MGERVKDVRKMTNEEYREQIRLDSEKIENNRILRRICLWIKMELRDASM